MTKPPLPPNNLLPKRFKVIVWRVLLISNFALAAYMFASPRKRDLSGMENKRVVKRVDDEVITNIPSTFMVDSTNPDADKISEDLCFNADSI